MHGNMNVKYDEISEAFSTHLSDDKFYRFWL